MIIVEIYAVEMGMTLTLTLTMGQGHRPQNIIAVQHRRNCGTTPTGVNDIWVDITNKNDLTDRLININIKAKTMGETPLQRPSFMQLKH